MMAKPHLKLNMSRQESGANKLQIDWHPERFPIFKTEKIIQRPDIQSTLNIFREIRINTEFSGFSH